MAKIKKKITCIIQARMNSTRLPGKVLKIIKGKITFLGYLILRLKKCKNIEQILIACSKNKKDKRIINFCKKNKIKFFVGEEKNVLKRYYDAAKYIKAENILRITSDCPFSDPKLIDKSIYLYNKKKADYLSNTIIRTFPDGLDFEIFTFRALKLAFKNAGSLYDKEHVTPYIIRSNTNKKYCVKIKKNLSHIRITLDTKKDLELLRMIANKIGNKIIWPWRNVLKIIK